MFDLLVVNMPGTFWPLCRCFRCRWPYPSLCSMMTSIRLRAYYWPPPLVAIRVQMGGRRGKKCQTQYSWLMRLYSGSPVALELVPLDCIIFSIFIYYQCFRASVLIRTKMDWHPKRIHQRFLVFFRVQRQRGITLFRCDGLYIFYNWLSIIFIYLII